MTSTLYRAEIDGLRAFAILPVVLFHAGVPGFSGGYVGVDCFFVISGYLITGIIHREVSAGNFSLSRFYERRIRRIFPALFVLLFFVLAASPFFLLPSEYRALPKEVLGALFFVANIVFWRDAGYFSADAEQKPLLHTWSLGVEEQFYIFAPLVLWFVLRYMFRLRFSVVVALAIASFMLSVYFTPIKPSASFYLLPTRAWELLVGALIALGAERAVIRGRMREVVATGGLAMLLSSVFIFHENTVFPGYAAALPVLGSAMIICSAQDAWVGRMLSYRPLVYIGLISYSLYLWHWPLIVFFQDWDLLENAAGKIFVVALSIFLAWTSWRFVETPFRQASRVSNARLFTWSGTGCVVIIGLACATMAVDGWPARFSPQVQRFDNARNDISPSRKLCHIGNGLRTSEDFCRLGTGPQSGVALWGDSHGVELSQGLADAGLSLITITYSSCSPGLGLRYSNRPKCGAHNEYVLDFLSTAPDIHTVILSARYPPGDDQVPLEIAKTAQALLQAGKRVMVIGPVPTPGFDVPSHLARGRDAAFIGDGPARKTFEGWFPVDARIVMPSDVFCIDSVCNMLAEGNALLFDKHHLSMNAAVVLAKAVLQAYEEQK